MIPSFKTAAAFVLLSVSSAHAQSPDDQYVPGPDSTPQAGVPKGTVTKHTWDKSKVFPGTTRGYWVYVSAQYRKGEKAAVFVCQDGILYEAPTVFDNLIHKKEMPVTIGISIQPGKAAVEPQRVPEG
jgi:enterochelin esterase-like enzyme